MSNFIKYLYFTLLCFFITLIIMDFFDKSLEDNSSPEIHSRDLLFVKNNSVIVNELRETQINNNLLIDNLLDKFNVLLSFNDMSGYFNTKFLHKFALRELDPKFDLLHKYQEKTYSFYKNCKNSLEKLEIMILPNALYTTFIFSTEKKTFIQNHKDYEKSNIELNKLSLDILNYLKKFNYFLREIRLREKNTKEHFRRLKRNINENREYSPAQKSIAVTQIETIEKNLKKYIFKQNVIPSFEDIVKIALEDFESIIIGFINKAEKFTKTPVQPIQEPRDASPTVDVLQRVNGSPGVSGLPTVNGLSGVDNLPGVDESQRVDVSHRVSGLPTVNGLSGVDVLPGVDVLQRVDGSPGVSGLPTVNGLSGVDNLPGVDESQRVDESHRVSGLPTVDVLPGVDVSHRVDGLSGVDGSPRVGGLPSGVHQLPVGVAELDSTSLSYGLGVRCVDSKNCAKDLYCRSGGFFKPKVCKEKKMVTLGQACNESEGVFCYTPANRKIECNRNGKCSYSTTQ
jgi:hypothetical protein